ncbi:hypothetical protein U1Q18_051416 [Sarracenia purpurea var. burkii]
MLSELCFLSVHGQQYPYPGVFYPPLPFTSPGIYQPPPFPFSAFPPYFTSQYYPAPTPDSSQPSNTRTIGYTKPKVVKPFKMSGSGPVILPNRGDSNQPIIISTRSSRRSQQPTLLSPLTNLIHTILKSLAPRTCDCDGDYR